jgi:hypothetical protein
MRHNPTLPVLTAEQEAELFAPVDTGRMKRMAMLQPSETEPSIEGAKLKTKISRELDQIKNKNNYKNKNRYKNKTKPIDMRAGGLVRKPN